MNRKRSFEKRFSNYGIGGKHCACCCCTTEWKYIEKKGRRNYKKELLKDELNLLVMNLNS